MPKHYFVWRVGSRGPTPAIYHNDPPTEATQKSPLGPQIIAIHEIPSELNEQIALGACPWAKLSEMFPPPTNR